MRVLFISLLAAILSIPNVSAAEAAKILPEVQTKLSQIDRTLVVSINDAKQYKVSVEAGSVCFIIAKSVSTIVDRDAENVVLQYRPNIVFGKGKKRISLYDDFRNGKAQGLCPDKTQYKLSHEELKQWKAKKLTRVFDPVEEAKKNEPKPPVVIDMPSMLGKLPVLSQLDPMVVLSLNAAEWDDVSVRGGDECVIYEPSEMQVIGEEGADWVIAYKPTLVFLKGGAKVNFWRVFRSEKGEGLCPHGTVFKFNKEKLDLMIEEESRYFIKMKTRPVFE